METYLIAEIGQAHDGSLGIAHSYIDALAKTGVNAVKFQTHIAEAESSEFEPFRVKFSYEDATRFDYWKRMQFTFEQWKGLKAHCEQEKMDFISSPFSNAAVDLLEDLNVCKYKVGSGEVNNFLLLEKIARTGKQILISSGLSNYSEIDQAFRFLRDFKSPISLLHCTTAYPTISGQWGVNIIPELKEKYNVPIGYSDHSGKEFPSIAAFCYGANIIEFHAVFDKRIFGPDSKASLTIDQIKFIVESIRQLESDKANFSKNELLQGLSKNKKIFEKSLAVNKNMKAGDILTFDALEAKKPKGYGIDASEFKKVLGKKLITKKDAYSFLNFEDIDE